MSLVEITIDGKKVRAEQGSMIIEVADQMGVQIPRFCYHKKLSIAANCRMCLVDVERSSKPLPACATPVSQGMTIQTRSAQAREAQRAVMEFLLINHPLDCPICDQGGECELQDVAMGYGSDVSRFNEGKRVVKDKNVGPLIATDMTRCIHCTRCVRFGDEIAGLRELGATGRGEHTSIGTYIEQAVASEVSGNVIDLCPVGALTSKPFRYRARSWELAQRNSISAHDCLGSNLHVHVRGGEVMRVVPKENEAINETWLSDRDRYSYLAYASADRLLEPMQKTAEGWQKITWQVALETAASRLKKVAAQHGADAIGGLISPNATLEEHYLMQRLLHGLGSVHVDHRLRCQDFSDQEHFTVAPLFNAPFARLNQLDAALLIGSDLRSEQPLAAVKLRRAVVAHQAKVSVINPLQYAFNMDLHASVVAAGEAMIWALAEVAKALLTLTGTANPSLTPVLEEVTVSETSQSIAASLLAADTAMIVLGAYAHHHRHAAQIRSWAHVIAKLVGHKMGFLTDGANSTGAWLAGSVPHRGVAGFPRADHGKNALEMLRDPMKAYVLFGLEPELDCAHAAQATRALREADTVICCTSYVSESMRSYADLLLPIAPSVETAGTFVNATGYWQSFQGVVPPLGESRPGWKVLRVLGNQFELEGFDFASVEDVRYEIKQRTDSVPLSDSGTWPLPKALPVLHQGLIRIATVPIYRGCPTVRRSPALQETPLHVPAAAYLNPEQAQALSLRAGDSVVVRDGDDAQHLLVQFDMRVPMGGVWIPYGLPTTSGLGADGAVVQIEKV